MTSRGGAKKTFKVNVAAASQHSERSNDTSQSSQSAQSSRGRGNRGRRGGHGRGGGRGSNAASKKTFIQLGAGFEAASVAKKSGWGARDDNELPQISTKINRMGGIKKEDLPEASTDIASISTDQSQEKQQMTLVDDDRADIEALANLFQQSSGGFISDLKSGEFEPVDILEDMCQLEGVHDAERRPSDWNDNDGLGHGMKPAYDIKKQARHILEQCREATERGEPSLISFHLPPNIDKMLGKVESVEDTAMQSTEEVKSEVDTRKNSITTQYDIKEKEHPINRFSDKPFKLGKLQVMKSGRAYLVLPNGCRFDVTTSMTPHCYSEAVMLRMPVNNDTPDQSRVLNQLGRITSKFTIKAVVPDMAAELKRLESESIIAKNVT